MGQRVSVIIYALFLFLLSGCGALDACAGEGPRYGDYKCNHDRTHRVCAKLKSNSGSKVLWGGQDFWHLTHQPDWSSQVGADPSNPGGGWCICMWATASLIEKVGCENVHLHCDATDVDYVLSSYHDGGQPLHAAHQCIKEKCADEVAAARRKRRDL